MFSSPQAGLVDQQEVYAGKPEEQGQAGVSTHTPPDMQPKALENSLRAFEVSVSLFPYSSLPDAQEKIVPIRKHELQMHNREKSKQTSSSEGLSKEEWSDSCNLTMTKATVCALKMCLGVGSHLRSL